MPPKASNKGRSRDVSSLDEFEKWDASELANIVANVLDDLETAIRRDPKTQISLKHSYNKPGYTFSVKWDGEWLEYTGSSMLGALIDYANQVLDITPPSPPLGGQGIEDPDLPSNVIQSRSKRPKTSEGV